MKHRGTPRRALRGIALIEALVSILIFSVGILGLVGLQVSMTRAQGSAKYRADAAYLGSDLMGRMWADRANVLAGKYVHPGDCSTHAPCADWLGKLDTSLPQGAAQVSTTASGTVTMTLTWSTTTEGTHSHVLATSIR